MLKALIVEIEKEVKNLKYSIKTERELGRGSDFECVCAQGNLQAYAMVLSRLERMGER